MTSTKQPIPEMRPVDRNMSDGDPTVAASGYDVFSWSPGRAGEGVPSSEVHLVLPTLIDVGGGRLSVALRLKSARALDELVGVLLQHRKDVWG